MDLPDASFDVILCQQDFQFFPDQPAALREMHRVLVPGGRAVPGIGKQKRARQVEESLVAKKKRPQGKKATRKPVKKKAKELPGVELEKIVAQFQTLMGPDATAEHNQRVRDRLGHLRQIDVLIRGSFGGWAMIGVIECKDHSRKKGLADVEAFAKKTEHLGAGLRLMVAKKGFAKDALRLAKHEHIGCLSLLPHASHNFGFTIGEWWYGIVSRWTDFALHVTWADPSPKLDSIVAAEVLWQGRPVINWFTREFVITYRDRTKDGQLSIDVPFDHVTNLTISGKEYPVKALTCSARGVFLKKRKWVTYSGQAFFNWHTGKITIPPGVQVHSQPMEADLLIWEDYQGEIPLLEDPTDKKLLRAVFVLTQFFDQSLPVPDLELLSTGERTDGRKPELPDPNVFDPNAVYVGKAVEEAGRTKRCT